MNILPPQAKHSSMEIFLLNIRYRLILLTNQKTAWKDILLSREFFLIIIFVVNFNIIICYNLYGIHVKEQLSFQQMKNACDCVFV